MSAPARWLAVGVALVCCATVEAAKLPDWAQQLADGAPDVGSEIPEDTARVLLNETRIEVQPDGKLRVSLRRAAQALRTDSDEVGVGYVHFDNRTHVERSRAWHLPPDGKAKKTRGEGAIDLALDDSFLSDNRTRLLPVSDIERGSLVFFEFELEEHPLDLVYPVIFQEDGPALRMRVAVQLPDGWAVEHVWLVGDGVSPVSAGTTHVWELEQLPAPRSDPLALSPAERAPYLLLAFRPPTGAEVPAHAFANWTDLAGWFERLSTGRADTSPEIAKMAEEVWQGPADELVPGVRRTGTWVRDRVRYVAKELGIGGYQPRPAADVMANLYGDCKDKGTLLRAMLSTRSIESYPVLVHLNRRDTVSERIPALSAFNHLVVAVPLPADGEIPGEIAAAVADGGDLGRLLIVDTTDESTAVGQLSAGLSGKTGLVVAGERSRLVELPVSPTGHRVERSLTAEIAADLSVSATVQTTLYGEPASRWRSAYRSSSKDYEEATTRGLRARWSGAELERLEVTEEADDGAFVEVMDVRIPAPANPETAELFSLFPGALDQLHQVTLSRRETPVQYPHPLTLRYTTRVRGARPGWGLPGVEERDGDGWVARSAVREESDEILGQFELELRRLAFEPEAFRDLRRFWSGARKVAGPALNLAGHD